VPPTPPTDQPASTPSAGGRERWWILVVVGVVGGLLSGAFGVGGGIIMVPLLITLAGMDQRRASATSLVAIMPTAIAGSITYLVAGRVDWIAAGLLAIGGIVGGWLGAMLLRRIPLGWLRWLFIAFLLLVAVRMLILMPPRDEGVLDHTVPGALGLVGIGLAIGIASGLFGIGGGVIAVPALMTVFGMGDLTAKGTSLLMMVPTSTSGTIANVRGRVVDVRAGLLVGIAATISSFGGVALAFLMSPAVSSYLFAGLLLAAAVQLSVRAIRMHRRR
jgi:uncharacterized protein